MLKRHSVSFYTLGCRLNQSETALLCDTFQKHGYEIKEFGEQTDVCVINTCSVTGHSEAHCRNMIRNVLRRHPDTFMVVVGCYAQVGLEAIKRISGVDMIVGTEGKFSIAEQIELLLEQQNGGECNGHFLSKREEPIIIHSDELSRDDFTINSVGNFVKHTRANIKIQDGCNFFCSYCIVPYARGRDRSREFEDIRKEAVALIKRGHREIVITGVNIGTYSFQGKNLLDVLKMLEGIDGVDRIRITSIEPMTIPEGLVEYVAASEKVCHFFHIPLQSGDNRILELMNRRYTREEFSNFVLKVAEMVPDVSIGTDIIVGFPGEGEAEFEHSRQLLAELPFMYAHVFSFSPRKRTLAAKLPNRVPPEIIKQRSQILHDLSAQKRKQFHTKYLGKSVNVLFERREKNELFTGYTGNYMKVGVRTEENLANTLRDAIITAIDRKIAIGEL